MKINVEVEIDPDSYALEYSLSPDEVKGDAQAHLKDLLEGNIPNKTGFKGYPTYVRRDSWGVNAEFLSK